MLSVSTVQVYFLFMGRGLFCPKANALTFDFLNWGFGHILSTIVSETMFNVEPVSIKTFDGTSLIFNVIDGTFAFM